MAEPIDLLFGLWRVGQRKHKYNRIHQVAPMCPHGTTHWRHEGTLAPPGKYDWTVRLQWQCGLMSNYCDHLLL